MDQNPLRHLHIIVHRRDMEMKEEIHESVGTINSIDTISDEEMINLGFYKSDKRTKHGANFIANDKRGIISLCVFIGKYVCIHVNYTWPEDKTTESNMLVHMFRCNGIEELKYLLRGVAVNWSHSISLNL